jgi:ribonuclease BN (tRNA processing enzyme)
MRLTTLGTGTISLVPGRACAGALVESGGEMVLLDIGSGVSHSLARHGIDWMSIGSVAITHFHVDHIGDLPTLIFAWKYGRIPGRELPLAVYGPPGTAELIGRLADAFGDWLNDPGFPVEVIQMEPGEAVRTAGGLTLESFKVPHTDESVAYSIRSTDRRLVYTGDTGWSPELAEWGRGCDLLLTECSLPSRLAIPTHLTPEQCGQLASRMETRKLVLTHFYPPIEELDVVQLVREHYAGPVSAAVDGWSHDLEAQ